jgi:hypothetical protein
MGRAGRQLAERHTLEHNFNEMMTVFQEAAREK